MGIYYNHWDNEQKTVQLENYVAIPCLIGYIIFTSLTWKNKQRIAPKTNKFHTQKSINFGTKIMRAVMVLQVLVIHLIFTKFNKYYRTINIVERKQSNTF